MMDWEFSFEDSPVERYLSTLKRGQKVTAGNLLTLLEEADEDAVDAAFELLEERELALDLTGLPLIAASGKMALRLRQEAEWVQKGLNTRQMEENDPLRVYLEELALTPAAGDEIRLAAEAAAGEESAMLALTNLGLSRVVELAAEHAGRGVLLLDLIQEGSLGLWQAIQNYSAGDYIAYRDQKIRNAIGRTILLQARSNGVGQKMRQAMQDYRSVDERLLGELGRNPMLEEIAQELHMSREEAETVQKMVADALLLQRAENANQPKEETPEDEQAVEDTAYFQMRQRIQELLSVLDETDAKLLTARFGLDRGSPMSPAETGRLLGLTVEEVLAREAAALALLRNEK